MCPSYLATRDEKDSTRGRARVLQELANGTLVKGFGSAEVAQALDLCLSCKGCSSDCPAGVDMATYKAEVLYQRYRRRLRPPAHYALGWLPRWAALASRAPGLANAALGHEALAGPAKRLAGVDARRPLPRFAARTFRDWFARRPPRAGSPVLLWVDTFTDHFTPEVGQAAVRVLEAAGYSVGITGQPGVLRADLDLHRPAGRRAPPAAAQPAGPGRRAEDGHPDRRAGALVHRRAARRPHRAAARRPPGPPGAGRHPHVRRAADRHPGMGTA